MSNEPLIPTPSAPIGSKDYVATVVDDIEAHLNTDVNDLIVGDTNYGKPFGKQSVIGKDNEYKGVINYNSNGEKHGFLSLCDQAGMITREAQYENGKPVSYNIVLDGVHHSWNKNETYQYCVSDGKNELRYNVDSTNRGYGNAILNGKTIVLQNGKIKKSGSICSFVVMLLLMIAGALSFIISML